MSRGVRSPTSRAAEFVECDLCRKRRRIGRAVSSCVTCDKALCEQHLDACGCPGVSVQP